MKTYMDCGLTGEQLADILCDFIKEILAYIDIERVWQHVLEKHPEITDDVKEKLEWNDDVFSNEAFDKMKDALDRNSEFWNKLAADFAVQEDEEVENYSEEE